jgi:hypothetical protein
MLKRKNDNPMIKLTLPISSFDRAMKMDKILLDEIVSDLSSQYKPMEPIKGLKLIL